MYIFSEYMTALFLVGLVAVLLLAVSVVLVAAKQGVTAVWRIGRETTAPAIAQESGLSLALQRAILTSTEPSAR
jgi:hypothetical protein